MTASGVDNRAIVLPVHEDGAIPKRSCWRPCSPRRSSSREREKTFRQRFSRSHGSGKYSRCCSRAPPPPASCRRHFRRMREPHGPISRRPPETLGTQEVAALYDQAAQILRARSQYRDMDAMTDPGEKQRQRATLRARYPAADDWYAYQKAASRATRAANRSRGA